MSLSPRSGGQHCDAEITSARQHLHLDDKEISNSAKNMWLTQINNKKLLALLDTGGNINEDIFKAFQC